MPRVDLPLRPSGAVQAVACAARVVRRAGRGVLSICWPRPCPAFTTRPAERAARAARAQDGDMPRVTRLRSEPRRNDNSHLVVTISNMSVHNLT